MKNKSFSVRQLDPVCGSKLAGNHFPVRHLQCWAMLTAAMSAAGSAWTWTPAHRTEPTYLHTSVTELAHSFKQDPGLWQWRLQTHACSVRPERVGTSIWLVCFPLISTFPSQTQKEKKKKGNERGGSLDAFPNAQLSWVSYNLQMPLVIFCSHNQLSTRSDQSRLSRSLWSFAQLLCVDVGGSVGSCSRPECYISARSPVVSFFLPESQSQTSSDTQNMISDAIDTLHRILLQ